MDKTNKKPMREFDKKMKMFDYPQGLDNRFQPGGRIKVLQDQDHDGQYDHGTVFLNPLPFPTGLLVWGNGVR